MNNYAFYAILIDHPWAYVVLLLMSAAIHYLIFRRLIATILDPYFFPVVYSVFSMADVAIMFYASAISETVALSYGLTQLAFWAGLYLFASFKYKIKAHLNEPAMSTSQPDRSQGELYRLLFFYTTTIILITTQMAIYMLKGIPLFMASRLQTFASGGGLGILGRITDVMTICSLYSFFSVVPFDRLRLRYLPEYLLFLLIFLTLALSGSKSGFLLIFHTLWAYIVFETLKGSSMNEYVSKLARYKNLIFAVCFVLVIGIIVVQRQREEKINPVFALVLRFVHSGDVYWYAYPHETYTRIAKDGDGIKALFTDALGMFRVYRWEDLPPALGITLKAIHHPSKLPEGPNARHNVFGLVYYGFWGSIFFSFLLGCFLSFTRNMLPMIVKGNLVGGVIFAYMVIKMSGLDSDPMLGLTYLNNLLFVLPILLLFVLLISSLALRKPRFETDERI